MLGHHWFREWIVACEAPSHYTNQCWFKIKFESKYEAFHTESAFEKITGKMTAILFRPQGVKLHAFIIWKKGMVHPICFVEQ